MKKFLQRLLSFSSNLATSKATQKAATVVVDKVGPHTALKKIGLVVALIGLLIALCGWFFLSSWWSMAVTGTGIILIITGMAMRSVNNLLIGLLVRLFKGLIKRFVDCIQRLRARFRKPGNSIYNHKQSDDAQVGTDGSPDATNHEE